MTRKFTAFLLAFMLFAGCLGLGAHAAEADAPYRVVATPYGDGIGIHWYTKGEAPGDFSIGGSWILSEAEATTAKFQGAYAHSARASGATPGGWSTYEVGDTQGKFRADPGRGAPINFIATGDVQASDANGFAYSARTVGAAWEKFPNSDFYVTLGDFTNDCTNEQWDLYFDAFKDINSKAMLVPVAGNHDGNFKWNWFANQFTLQKQDTITNLTGVNYSFDYGDAHFAVLNSNDMYPMSVVQRNWLINDMKRSDAKWKIVFLHRACYSAGNDAILPDNLLMRRALIPLFDELGIDLVMNGHDHQYYRSVPVKADKPADGGTVYIMPGAAANKRYAMHETTLPAIKNNAAKHAEPGKPVYTHLAIDGNTLTYEAYTFDPETGTSALYDNVELQKTTFNAPDPDYKPLSTDFFATFPQYLWNLLSGLFNVLVLDYLFTLLPAALGA